MSKGFPDVMARLIEGFCKMPGVGVRSAERMAFYVLRAKEADVESLARSITEVKRNVSFCRECNNLSESDLCLMCSEKKRDRSRICVVEGPNGVMAVERTGSYNGLYHVLLGALSPIDGIGPGDIRMGDLVRRAEDPEVKEIIIATDFTTEGQTTALFISKVLGRSRIKVTRLSRGVPEGACVEYADVGTLQRAFEDRRTV
jgi:recombination protein RecR